MEKTVDHLKSHATTDYHQESLAKLKTFQSTYLNTSTITHDADEKIRTQGIALRGHRRWYRKG